MAPDERLVQVYFAVTLNKNAVGGAEVCHQNGVRVEGGHDKIPGEGGVHRMLTYAHVLIFLFRRDQNSFTCAAGTKTIVIVADLT